MRPFEERHRKAHSNRKIYITVAAPAVAAGLVCAVSSSTEHSAAAAVNLATVTAIEPRSLIVRVLLSARYKWEGMVRKMRRVEVKFWSPCVSGPPLSSWLSPPVHDFVPSKHDTLESGINCSGVGGANTSRLKSRVAIFLHSWHVTVETLGNATHCLWRRGVIGRQKPSTQAIHAPKASKPRL
ncbi:unnamed protein product [Ectocarpus sp. 12 AP-2014]